MGHCIEITNLSKDWKVSFALMKTLLNMNRKKQEYKLREGTKKTQKTNNQINPKKPTKKQRQKSEGQIFKS